MRIFILSRDRENLDSLTHYLSRRSTWIIRAADHLNAAIQALKQSEYQVLLLDVNQSDWTEVIRSLKVISPETQFIISCEKLPVKLLPQLMKLGVYDILLKPLNLKELIFSVEELEQRLKRWKLLAKTS